MLENTSKTTNSHSYPSTVSFNTKPGTSTCFLNTSRGDDFTTSLTALWKRLPREVAESPLRDFEEEGFVVQTDIRI